MDHATIGFATYRWHRICNPFTLNQLERTLAFADLQPGDKAADIGCGNAFVSCWMAERYGLDLTALERYPAMAELAREAAAQPRARGTVDIIEGGALAYLAEAGEHRLLSLLGAIDVVPGLKRPDEIMATLAPSIAPGGWLLWGDPFWITPPGPRLTAIFSEDRYATLAGWMAAGEAAGLTPCYAAVSTDADWEEFVWRMNASLIDFADHAAEPDATAIRLRAALLRTLYLEEGRERMGFGLYLFRKPAV
jgi:SAM-dependent methyltransferase